MKFRIDLVGNTYGRLTVISFAGDIDGKTVWNCICDCGNEKVIRGADLTIGKTKSCGCLRIENAKNKLELALKAVRKEVKLSEHPLYQTWASMNHRCYSPLSSGYKYYGGRGITVCDRWRNSFLFFIQDMYPKPDGYTLERKDNNKGYSFENCRWATPKEQASNRRKAGTT